MSIMSYRNNPGKRPEAEVVRVGLEKERMKVGVYRWRGLPDLIECGSGVEGQG